MVIEEALATALQYERKVRDRFTDLANQAGTPDARAFFGLMAREEQGHVDYLEAKLKEWRATGDVAGGELTTAVPPKEWLQKGAQALTGPPPPNDHGSPLDHLTSALRLEEEVSAFYRELADTVDHPRAALIFRRFLEIEDGHTALVRAQIDHETHTGNFFDLREFTLDG